MESTVSLPLHSSTLSRLVAHLRQGNGGPQDLAAAVTDAVNSWICAREVRQQGADADCVRGYQWKSLFLPEGTVLRSWSYGEHNYARVEGDHIIHRGRTVSPNQFAQSFARTTRNAWTDLYIRRPGDERFYLACRLRSEQAKQAKLAAPVAPADDITKFVLALLAAKIPAPIVQLPPAPAPRNVPPGPGWNLPERRKFRYRIEDVAFE
ncbi:hypothetical protein [Rugamonas apoptosis]|uniref:Uncharacterized protein n=1 Tax=Rugamonas apoptosis TaxID=2758570 RepID=A0A7W2FB37_9BURK|nr:hypothetical protein [Rugamonas apoptosis]MBA5688329.1 hypothetical protein [Rugamonas apoptosis]